MNEPIKLHVEQEVILRLILTEACAEMFTSSGFVVRLLDVSGPLPGRAHDIAGFIGFGGVVRGSLMIAGPKKLFRSTYPSELSDGNSKRLSDPDLFDWTGEMANQILGRVKKGFCERGRDFDASTPTAMAGRELGRRFPGRAGALDLVFAVGGDVVSICFEITPPADGKIFPVPAEPIDVSVEGDMFLF